MSYFEQSYTRTNKSVRETLGRIKLKTMNPIETGKLMILLEANSNRGTKNYPVKLVSSLKSTFRKPQQEVEVLHKKDRNLEIYINRKSDLIGPVLKVCILIKIILR